MYFSKNKNYIIFFVAISLNGTRLLAQQNFYDSSNPQGPNYNPNNSPQYVANTDSSQFETDTSKKSTQKYGFWKNPKVATLASMILPGLGQAYNKKYWKVPIVWGIMGTLGYFFYRNSFAYDQYRDAYFYANGLESKKKYGNIIGFEIGETFEPATDRQNKYDALRNLRESEIPAFAMGNQISGADSIRILQNLASLRDDARRGRDFMGLFLVLSYVLNMADAAVDAHFASFDVSSNLSMRIDPKFMTDYGMPQVGLSLQLLVIDNRKKQKDRVKN